MNDDCSWVLQCDWKVEVISAAATREFFVAKKMSRRAPDETKIKAAQAKLAEAEKWYFGE